GGAFHHLTPAEFVPNLSVTFFRAFKQPRAALSRVIDFEARQDAPQLVQNAALVIHQSRVFGGQMDRDAQRLVNPSQRGFIGSRERIATVFARVPTRSRKRSEPGG